MTTRHTPGTCPVCHEGTLRPHKIYRMPGAIALLGIVGALGSSLAIVAAVFGMLNTAVTEAKLNQATADRIREQLTEAGIDRSVIDQLVDIGSIDPTTLGAYSDSKLRALEAAKLELEAARESTGVAAGIFQSGFVAIAIGGGIVLLISLGLTSRRRVWKCAGCRFQSG